MRVRGFAGVAVLVAGAASPCSGAQQAPLAAPYQVEALELAPDAAVGEAASGAADGEAAAPLVVVAFDRAPNPATRGVPGPPAEAATEWVTILGTAGFVHATKTSLERRCRYPCGDEANEECHRVGLYRPVAPLASIGEAVGALPGRLELEDYVRLASTAAGPARLATRGEPTELLWSGPYGGDLPMRLRVDAWDPGEGRLRATLDWGSEVPLDGSRCEATEHEWLLVVDCGEFALLASGGRPLLLSLADYNSAKAEPLARFVYGGSRHYVVRYGAKAQDVVGLVSGEPAGWRARFRARDWAQIC